ncbi:MAG: DUF2254 domain-containing protein [Saprospiraceae bacterium]
MKKLLFFWSQLKSTFWFVPFFIILISIGLVIGLLNLDGMVTISREGIGRFIFVNSAGSARSILTTISGAMISVAGTVFSITLVALTLASSQLGSRLIKNFMYDRLNQVVLGSYVSTFICCLVALNTINETDQFVFIPHYTILASIIAAIVNIILLIVFIHHIAISIQADTVIANISKTMSANLNTLFPGSCGVEMEGYQGENVQEIIQSYGQTQKLRAGDCGYVQYIDTELLMDSAAEFDLLIELDCSPGDYLVKGMVIGIIHSNKILEEADLEEFQAYFITGNTRTHQQDAEYSIHQLVEIASKALSPGINDPYTAIACIDNLATSITDLSSIQFPSKYRFDEDKKLRIIAEVLYFEGMVDVAFNQIRQFSKGSPAVVIRLMEALIIINKAVEQEAHQKAIKKHAKMVLNLAEQSFSEPNDIEDLRKRWELVNEIAAI